ncbi:DUF192 domain-containing protein [Phototrophicus methaneseepsis]|uniref:DUF192 domain-containing protein n=1 Tax=Phototrophicus methaneseepsis TaxID=2710758 RepID=A0A7S8IC40_9CHLR|nr:DUF192 domain-containing protein [Phototrophicus methaneseepsis]QPC81135.1 DUF192 domain-containing protein [Phototrophicus methaneseepsis]
MSEYRRVINAKTQKVVLERAKWCVSFWCRFRGLQFVTHLDPDEGLLFVSDKENKQDTAIHMLFMFMSIAVIWIDANGVVVDKRLAKPWRLAYIPAKPAQYFIEANTALLDQVNIGDKLTFDQVV